MTDERFIYDGWNLIAELSATNNAPIRSYLWGKDLSGSINGAGGIGGLVMITDHAGSTYHFTAYDESGNITALVKSDGSTSANYEYDPFGQTIRITGSLAKANPLRFSTKFTDDETDLIYYGYRYYHPSLGRWINRDPIGEDGGIDIYAFVLNNPINGIDTDGRVTFADLWADLESLLYYYTYPQVYINFFRSALVQIASIGEGASGLLANFVDVTSIAARGIGQLAGNAAMRAATYVMTAVYLSRHRDLIYEGAEFFSGYLLPSAYPGESGTLFGKFGQAFGVTPQGAAIQDAMFEAWEDLAASPDSQ